MSSATSTDNKGEIPINITNKDLFDTRGLVAGSWKTPSDRKSFPVYEPSSGKVLRQCFDFGHQDFDDAIDVADQGYRKFWSSTTAKERGALLRRWYELILENTDDLAVILSLENGKNLAEAQGEVKMAASYVSWFAEEATRSYGETIPSSSHDTTVLTFREPVGVCGIITPWNFPAAMITRKIAPAFAAGCSVVIKPPSETPFSAISLAKLAVEAGIPESIIHVVPTKDRQASLELATNPKVKKLSFTGSTGVGKMLTKLASGTMKKVSMELGGNAPLIVFEDANLDLAVEGALAAKFRCAGQTCVCANRIYVQSSILESFSSKLVERVSKLSLGNGLDQDTTLGPLVNAAAVQREMEVARDETFGPLAAIFSFDTEEEVIALANDTEFGLAGYFFCRDIGRVMRVARQLECGMVGVNTGLMTACESPFGGIKESGVGIEGSKYGLAEYQNVKGIDYGFGCYVDSLRDRVESLRGMIRETRSSEYEDMVEPAPASIPTPSNTLPKVSPNYSGSGSIFKYPTLHSSIQLGHANDLPVLANFLGDAVELVKLYFDALHVTMPSMRQADVFQQLERLYTGNPPYTGHEKTQDLFQLHMIFAIGAMRSPGRWREDCARDHYLTAIRKEAHLTTVPAPAQVQNLLLVFVFATLHDVGIASTWEIIRQAMRVCVKYGFHSRETAVDDALSEQLRRRIFWSAYISDRYSSQNLGRPTALAEEDVTVDIPMNQDDDTIKAGEPEIPGRYTEVTNLIRHTLLRRLGTNARTALNRLSRQRASLTEQIEATKAWTDALEAWYNSSIVKPNPTNAYETKEYLDINFHRERMKFLSYLVLPSDAQDTTASIEHSWQYTLSAYQILLSYQKQSNDGFLAPNWTYVQDVLKSGFGILYCAVGIPEQRRRSNEGAGLLPPELDTIVNALKLCGETLKQITAEWQTVQRHANAFVQMSESVLELIASTTRNATREQSHTDAGEDGSGDIMDWNLEELDSTLNLFQSGEIAPFTDADWAELFDLAVEMDGEFSVPG
ncbi:hypothetical protein FSARC_12154 [Fusarium sarcochroum]|uniref:Succinate-semialdehyde dehydrogenase, mitochondrial n=1 Tax=Fusarium sarcochroum TaxID=1208366 RepID=A0A8H4TB28_9HYPO|nr:hypothetical protein FSARC_12154 [Fusarium sarcochroum]